MVPRCQPVADGGARIPPFRETEGSSAPARPRAGRRDGSPTSRARRAHAEPAGRERSLRTSGPGRTGNARGEARPRSAEHSPGRPPRPAIPAPAPEGARLRWDDPRHRGPSLVSGPPLPANVGAAPDETLSPPRRLRRKRREPLRPCPPAARGVSAQPPPERAGRDRPGCPSRKAPAPVGARAGPRPAFRRRRRGVPAQGEPLLPGALPTVGRCAGRRAPRREVPWPRSGHPPRSGPRQGRPSRRCDRALPVARPRRRAPARGSAQRGRTGPAGDRPTPSRFNAGAWVRLPRRERASPSVVDSMSWSASSRRRPRSSTVAPSKPSFWRVRKCPGPTLRT